MEIKDILLLVVPALSAFITYVLTKRAKRDEAIFKYKEEKYGNLILLIQGFLDKGSKNTPDIQNKFFEEQYKSWLYSSDEVVLAVNNLVSVLRNANKGEIVSAHVAGEVIVAMRKDMLKNTKLKASDFQFTIVGKNS